MQKVSGRVEKIYTPVEESEIAKVVRRRLFSHIDLEEADKVISNFIDYAEREKILPYSMQPSEYRARFMDSYPFMPEVIDVFYHRWGSYPTFQRTRGVLRILSLVIYSLINKAVPNISLADFDLSNQEIRQELLKHIGAEFNSVLGQDITDKDSGARKVDAALGSYYKGLNFGTRAATTIFLYSFSGGGEKGASIEEIKRSSAITENTASVVVEAVEQLKEKLFYLQSVSYRYHFSNKPNINRILLTKIENIKDKELSDLEKELLSQNCEGDKLKVYLWVEDPSDIFDSEELKLIILEKKDEALINNILKYKGVSPRVNVNTLFFLYPNETVRGDFLNQIKKKIAYEHIEKDKGLSLTDEQRSQLKEELKRLDFKLSESLKRTNSLVAIPTQSGITEMNLGVPTYGEKRLLTKKFTKS